MSANGKNPLETRSQIDALCDAFEASWRAGQEPRIEAELEKIAFAARHELLKELLLVEWELVEKQGASIRVDDYVARFPEDATLIRQALAEREPKADFPRIIGRYKLLEKIGEGGFGEVWMAEQREPVKRRVALKIIKPGMDSKQVVARFEAERQALAMMDHPNIAKILDAGTTGENQKEEGTRKKEESSSRPPSSFNLLHSSFPAGRPYFVMELVRGIKITDYCDQNELSTADRLRLFVEVCKAVQHAHLKGVVHRDLKPSNVLVTVNDGVAVPKVIDFGIAKAMQGELTDKTVFTQFQQFIGTPAYVSPEQAEMSSLDIDTRVDIYSLGVLLYELLVGQTPFDAKEMMKGGLDALRKIIREQEPQRPSTRLNTLPGDTRTTTARRRRTDSNKLAHQLRGDLDWIVLKCLEKDRNRRYETANGLAADLQRHLDNEPVLARPPSLAYQLQKAWQRNKLVASSAAAIAFALLLGISISTWQMIRATGAEREQGRLRGQAEAERRLAQEAQASEAKHRQSAEQERDRATQLATRLDKANDQLLRSTTRAEFAAGHQMLEAGQPEKGIAHLARALRTDPKNWPAATRLISTLTDRGFALDDLPPITHDQPIYEEVLDRSTGLLVTRGLDSDLRVWNAWKAERLMDIPATGSRGMPTLSSDGKRFLFVDTNGWAHVFEPFTNPRTPVATLRAQAPIVHAILSPAPGPGLKAATRLADGTVQFWNAESGTALSQPLNGSSTNGGFLAFTRDGQWLVGSFSDGKVGVWPTPPQIGAARMIPATKGNLLTLAPDSKTLIERARDSLSLRFWDLVSGEARGPAIPFREPLVRVPGEPDAELPGIKRGLEFSFSDDGRHMLAVAHDTGDPNWDSILHLRMEVHLFDVSAGRIVRTLSETNVTFRDESLVAGLSAMVHNTNRLVIRSLSTGAVLVDRLWPSDTIKTIQFAPAGDRILVALTDRRMIFLDTRTGESMTHPGEPARISMVAGGSGRTPGHTYFMRHRERINRLEFSPEGDVFLVHDSSGKFQLWDSFEGIPLSEPLPVRSGRVGFSQDGLRMVALSTSGAIQVLGRDLSAARHPYLSYRGLAPALHISADGRYGLVGRNGLEVFDPSSGKLIQKVLPADVGEVDVTGSHTWLICEAWFSPSGEKIVAVCNLDSGRFIKVFETATGKTLHSLPTPKMTLPFRARFAGENRVVIGSHVYQDGLKRLKVWDLPSRQIVAEATPDQYPYFLEVSPDGRRVASASSGIALLDGADLKPVCPILLAPRKKPVGIYTLAFSPDSRRLVAAYDDGFARVWKAETGELEAELEHGAMPRWVGFSPDSQRVVATGSDYYNIPSVANVWEFAGATTRRVTASLTHPNTIVHAKFSADGQYLLAGDRAGTAQFWDLETSLPMLDRPFVDADGGVTRVAINPQTTRVFIATHSGNELHQRPLPPRGVAVPDWLPPLAEAVAGHWVNDRGAIEPLGQERLREVKAAVAQLPTQSGPEFFYPQWARWFFADRATRAVAPLASMTVPEEMNSLLADGSLHSLRRAHRISPTDARVFAALARELAAHEEFRENAPAAGPEMASAPEWYAAQAVQRAPALLEAHWSQAEVLLQLGQAHAARRTLAGAIRLQADHPNVLALQSELAWREGRTEEAQTLLSRALNAPVPKPISAYLRLASIARRPDFFAQAALRNRTEHRLAGRPLNLPVQFVDLTPWYTGPVDGALANWLVDSAKPAPGFAAPVFEREGFPFDLRGVVSFNSYPTSPASRKAILGLPIGQRAGRMHFLAGGNAPGLRLRVRYADLHHREFRLDLVPDEYREFHVVSWDNPRPEIPIQTIDIVALPNSEPIIAAITVQTEPDPVIGTQPQPAFPRVTLGQPLELHVAVATPGSWSYQWSVNQQPIPGATHPALRIATTSAKDLARYEVEIRPTAPDPANRGARSRPVWTVDATDPVARGILKEELFLNVPGKSIEDLRKSLKFPGRPDAILNPSALEVAHIPHENFGRRCSGFLVPKESADYVFYLCSDDASALALSADDTAGKLKVIATLSGHAGWRNWEALRSESISKPIRLEAGRRYFFELLHKESGWGNHVSVTWRKAGEPAPKNDDPPISAEFLQLPAE